jgi:Na+/H+ antiporter NhaD/arsenite permease-like protein
LLLPEWATAAQLDGKSLNAFWGLPFVALLLCIALMPLLCPRLWHPHFGKIAALCAAAFVVPFAWQEGVGSAWGVLAHTLLYEYLPFIILLTALYTVAGGIFIRGNLHGSPGLNTALLAIGALLASFMGTTGASMLMIRPMIRANDNRKHRAHVVVFFIFIVSNAGGALTPLGDPPLFLGFLAGVKFFWTLQHMWQPTLFLVGCLLGIFYLIDTWFFRHETPLPFDPTPDTHGIAVEGRANIALLAVIMGLVLQSGLWSNNQGIDIAGMVLPWAGVVRDVGLLLVIFVSWYFTSRDIHTANQFSWGPMQEVAKLFAGIFLTIVPVIALLRAGVDGPFGGLIHAVTQPDGQPDTTMYFWITGALSSFLDNAPTYLVFFNTAGGNAAQLMGPLATTLAAISAGAVFMGANSYIGNAPNMMVKAVAEERGVRMPSFFGYMVWSTLVLLPLFGLMTLIWFR